MTHAKRMRSLNYDTSADPESPEQKTLAAWLGHTDRLPATPPPTPATCLI